MRSKLVVGVSGVVLCSACGLFPDLSPLTKDGGTSLDATAGDSGDTGAPDAQPDGPVTTCPSSPCAAGHCQPVVLVSDATSDARGMAQTPNLLLWATGCTGVVRKVGKDGAGNTPLPAGAHCTPTIAVGGPNVYWIEYDGPYLYTTPIDGSQPASIVAEVTQTGARSDFARLAVDGQNAYWATTTPAAIWYAPLTSNHITALPIAGPSVQQQVTAPYGVAVDASYVYWADQGAGFIKRRAIASLGQDMLAQMVINETGPHDITLDATNVYFVTTDGFVRAIAKDGTGNPQTLASGQAKAESIIVDDRYVYWTIYAANATVNRVPKGGGSVEVLATGQNYPYSLTQDCDTIYWTNQADFATGQVMKLTK